MPTLQISKKHHKHLNNPFPPNPKSLGFIHGRLTCNPNIPNTQNFEIGQDFQLSWCSKNGGSLSVFHKSEPTRAIWSTIPGEAFVSAGVAETQVEESRGSFAISDNGLCFCNHQTVDDIRLVYRSEIDEDIKNSNSQNADSKSDPNSHLSEKSQDLVFLITGWIYSSNEFTEKGFNKGLKFKYPPYRKRELKRGNGLFIASRYWFFLDQKTSHQLGFQVKLGKCNPQFFPGNFSSISRSVRSKVRRFRARHFRWAPFRRGFFEILSKEEKKEEKLKISELNRVFITYSSEDDEKFYGFGEQFSHMEFKGKRVPIFVQEQGIGRGDQPITLAANLISYRSGGDWSTTYAPSPFYMTSKMKSLYLEGYSYSVFDLTKHDRVQIQICSGSAQGRILHGTSPVEIIERFTETIGRLPELPDWIVSGAVIGMQGGTDYVLRVWNLLQQYDIPISAFWLQDWVGQRETMIGSQLWWNWEVDAERYPGWKQLLDDLCACNIRICSGSAQGRILHGTSPVEIIERFTETIGRLPELPDWIVSGAVIGMQGGTDYVLRVWNLLQQYDIPISAFWLQDWVGQRETMIGSQLWWNWEVDAERYPGWKQLLDDLCACNIRVMTYCNPCLAPTDEKPNRKRNLFWEASKLGLLVKDKNGETYMVPNTSFDVGMLDLTNPATGKWFKQILHEMVDSGVRGWMADFGEGLPLDSSLFSGEDPVSAHNRYPELWAKINREFVDEWKSTRQAKEGEEPDEGLVFFVRAGFRESPKWATLFWEGDQMVSWQRNDGIKSAVVGLLSSGVSGYAFNHSDIGGYCAVNLPFMKYRRSEELLLRWMELNAFSTVFRTHEGNNPSANSQFYSNNRTLSHFARFAKVYKAWKFYRIQLVKEAAERGLPVLRHLFLHYPEDDHVQRLTYQQFLVGTEILVVPVLDKGKKSVKAYFPLARECSWKHIWTGELYGGSHSLGPTQGFEAWVEAPIGYPAIFVKSDSPIGDTFLKNLRDLDIL